MVLVPLTKKIVESHTAGKDFGESKSRRPPSTVSASSSLTSESCLEHDLEVSNSNLSSAKERSVLTPKRVVDSYKRKRFRLSLTFNHEQLIRSVEKQKQVYSLLPKRKRPKTIYADNDGILDLTMNTPPRDIETIQVSDTSSDENEKETSETSRGQINTKCLAPNSDNEGDQQSSTDSDDEPLINKVQQYNIEGSRNNDITNLENQRKMLLVELEQCKKRLKLQENLSFLTEMIQKWQTGGKRTLLELQSIFSKDTRFKNVDIIGKILNEANVPFEMFDYNGEVQEFK